MISINTALFTKIKLSPHELNKDFKSILKKKIRNKYEGKCSEFGYVIPNTISINNYSLGIAKDSYLNGDVEFYINFNAELVNPAIGSIIKGKVINHNVLGTLTQSFIKIDDVDYPVIETYIVFQLPSKTVTSEININEIKENTELIIEIIGKKFELNDTKISTIGKIINPNDKKIVIKNEEDHTVSNVYENEEDVNSSSKESSHDSSEHISTDSENEENDIENEEEKQEKEESSDDDEASVVNDENPDPEGDEGADDEVNDGNSD